MEPSRMSQMPAHLFSKDLKPTNFLLFFPLKPYFWSYLNVPGRVGCLSWSVTRFVVRYVEGLVYAAFSLPDPSPLLFGVLCFLSKCITCLSVSLLRLSLFSPVTLFGSSVLLPLIAVPFSSSTIGWLTTAETQRCTHSRLKLPSHGLQPSS